MEAETAIFGRVKIQETFLDEAAARAAGYNYDAHAYRVNVFGGTEPVSWKVLARSTDFTHREYAAVGCEKEKGG